ncbi:MAG: helix-turn-helix domain-containing protein [Mesorhizobium sp.]|nr:helix-turn-helix domain-containing protein [Mesorhizobium sp.]
MDVRPIRDEADYDWALREVSRYFERQPEKGSPEGDRFEVLLALIAVYEDAHYPMPIVDPIDMLRYQMELKGRSQSDLAAVLGSRARASEVLNRKRPLTLDMIAKLRGAWGISADLLIADVAHAA